jgi:hypothetical protein
MARLAEQGVGHAPDTPGTPRVGLFSIRSHGDLAGLAAGTSPGGAPAPPPSRFVATVRVGIGRIVVFRKRNT